MAFEIINITLQAKDEGELKQAAYFAGFTTKKGERTLSYNIDLLPPDPKNFIPFDQLTDAEKDGFIRAKMGHGYTMTEAEFETELDRMG